MKLLTTTLAVALLSQMGSAHAGDDVYLTYVNRTKSSVEILYDQSSVCMYQRQIPNDIVVPPGQNFGPYYAETNQQFLTSTCSGGILKLDIITNGIQSLTQCTFSQYGYGRAFILENCTGAQSLRVSIDDAHKGGITSVETLTIFFDDKPSTNSHLMVKSPLTEVERYNTSKANPMMNKIAPHHAVPMPNFSHSHMTTPHTEHEVEHYNTSKVNPMMNQHKMEFHQGSPMANNQRVMNQPQRPAMNQRKFESHNTKPAMKNRKVENAKPMINKR